MTTPSVQSHDLTLSDGSTTLGLVALKKVNKDGSESIVDMGGGCAESLAPQQFTNFGQAAFPPTREAPLTLKEFHAGFGADYDTARRYRQTTNADASTIHLIKPSPVIVATTKSTPTYTTIPAVANGGFETGDFTSWIGGGGAFSVVNTGTPHAGTYHMLFTAPGDSAFHPITQQLICTAPLINNGTVTISAYSKKTAGGSGVTGSAYLKNAAGTVIATATLSLTGSYVQATGPWSPNDGYPGALLTVDIELNDGGDNTVRVYVDDITVTWTGSITTATDMGTIKKIITFNNLDYAISETGVWKRTADNWARVAGSPDAIVDAATDGTYLYLARGPSKNFWYMNTGETFTRCPGSSAQATVERFAYCAGIMWGQEGSQTVYKYNDITVPTVTTTYTVGTANTTVTDFKNHIELPYLVKTTEAFYLASGAPTWTPIATELQFLSNANTGKNSISFGGDGAQSFYIPAGSGPTLLDPSDAVTGGVGPNMVNEGLTDFTGQIVATAADDKWMYVFLDNGSKKEVLKGAWVTIEGVTSFIWHTFLEDTYATVGYAVVTTPSGKRLYYGGGITLPKYVSLAGDTYQTGALWESSWLEHGSPDVSKSYTVVKLDSTGLSTGHRTVKIEYKLWGDANWTELGGAGIGSFDISPSESKAFASGVASTRIRLRATLNTDSSTTSLGVIAITLYAVVNPPRLETFHTFVRVASDYKLRNGVRDDDMTYGKVSTQLLAWRHTHPLTLTQPIKNNEDGTFVGRSLTCKFEEGYPKYTMVSMGNVENPAKDPVAIFELLLVQTRTS